MKQKNFDQLSDWLSKYGIIAHNQSQPLYKYTSVESFLKIIENNTLQFSTPAKFNDPFEFNEDCFLYSFTPNVLNDIFRRVAKNSKDHKHLENFDFSNISEEEFRDIYINMVLGNRDKSLVFCASESPLHTLMWSHYANHHKGICFGILMPEGGENGDLLYVSKKVKYCNQVNSYNFFTSNPYDQSLALYNWVFTKAIDWQYEKEVRTFISNPEGKISITNGNYYYQFDKSLLIEIYYGLLTPEEDILKIEESLSKHGYNVKNKYVMRRTIGSYTLTASPVQ